MTSLHTKHDNAEHRGLRSQRNLRPLARTATVVAFLAALPAAAPAAAETFTLRAETAGALWLDEPQMSQFGSGFYLAIRPSVALGRVITLQSSYAVLLVPAGDGRDETGSAHFLLGGVRLRPLGAMAEEGRDLAGLFADLNAGYVRTDDRDRFGFDAGIGFAFQISDAFSMGPVVRYSQIFQPDDNPTQNPNDAQLVSIGLDFGFGRSRAAEPEHTDTAVRECAPTFDCPDQDYPDQDCPDCPDQSCPEVSHEECAGTCPDRDRDGVCDRVDRCPDRLGPPATLGCPIDPCGGAPLIVLVQFDYDSAELPHAAESAETMDPVLDAVAEAIDQDATCNVCIVGHASEEGDDDYNVDLSQRRANAVRDYLTDRNLHQSRMPTTGLGAQCQIIPETTRSLNRRVEFHRLQDGESCPTDCSE